MDIKRIISYVIVALLGVALYNAWIRDYPPAVTPATPAATEQQKSTDQASFAPATYNPSVATKTKAAGTTAVRADASSKSLVQVKTDVLEVAIDTRDGNIVSAQLPKYPISVEEKNTPISILSGDPNEFYVLQSGLTNTGKDGQTAPIQFSSAKSQYTLESGQNQLAVTLTGKTANGLSVTKTYLFQRNDYAVKLIVEVANASGKTWSGSLYTQITRRQPSEQKSHFYTRSYDGAAISSPNTPYEKLSYKTLDKASISRDSRDGWIAMQQHYFLSAWIPLNPNLNYHYYSHVVASPSNGNNIYIVGFVSPQMTVAANAKAQSGATFYVGPEVAKRLKGLAPGLDRTIDYGWLWPVSIILFWIMSGIHTLVRNWGWSIVVTTILIKIVFYWFSAKSFRSMARLREMQPRMQALKERHGSDRQALSKATMELYRKEKINPLGGCLPMVIQIPVFIAFYYVIIESVELRQAPFIFWIHDLSMKDPYYVLPILMGLSMLLQQWLSPTSPDPTQQKMMWILPIVFTVFFVNFPAGLVLYWFTNNIVQALQQWYVNKTYEKHKAKLHEKRLRKKYK